MPSASRFFAACPPPHGGACPRNFNIDVTCARAYVTLGELHLDHEQDLVVTCDMWHVGAGARGAPAPARARGTTASTARFCSTCSRPALLGARRPPAEGAATLVPGRCASVAAPCTSVASLQRPNGAHDGAAGVPPGRGAADMNHSRS